MMGACAPLRAPMIVKKAPIEMFKYAYISPTKELTSSTGSTYGGNMEYMDHQQPRVLIPVISLQES